MRGWPEGDHTPAGRVLVRRCTEADVAALESGEPPGSGYVRGAFARQKEGAVDFLVGLVDGAPVGSAELTHDDPPELKNLGVDEAARSRGLGAAIVRAAEALVEERMPTVAVGQRALVVGVGLENPRAAALYERLGYERTGELSTTTYTYVDSSGITKTATERDEELIKRW